MESFQGASSSSSRSFDETTEIQPRKGTVSCAECRRSKLKCNRVFPCEACIRRGCPKICPTGTLTATKGNKVLMTQVTHLKNQTKMMSSRIRELEAALAQRGIPAPEMRDVGPSNSDSIMDHSLDAALETLTETIGTLSIGLDGQTRYHGESASSEYFGDLLDPDTSSKSKMSEGGTHLSEELEQLISHFPMGMKDSPSTKSILLPYLPRRDEAIHLASLYYRNASWMYDPLVEKDFYTLLLDPIYGSVGDCPTLDHVSAHSISAFFMVLATGAYYLDTRSHEQPKYWQNLARAAHCLESLYTQSSVWTVQTLLMMVKFMLNVDPGTYEPRWLLTGLCVRIAQQVGLQTDSERWGLDPDEVQRRRNLFWELFTYESWMGLVNGRSPSLSLSHTDVRFPDDKNPIMTSDGRTEMGWHAWKFRYSAECLSPAVQQVFSTRTGGYPALLDLDRKIRHFPVPHHLQTPVRGEPSSYAWSDDPYHAMAQYCLICEREANLLYMHRPYFVTAIKTQPNNPLEHMYGYSVRAVYGSAARLIFSLKDLHALEKFRGLTETIWFFWSGIFSSCITLAALVVESPACTLSDHAHRLLQDAVHFFDLNSSLCRPDGTSDKLKKLAERAYNVYTYHKCGLVTPNPTQSETDEMAVLRGQRSVIDKTSPASSPRDNDNSSRRTSGSFPPPSNRPSPPDTSQQFRGPSQTPPRSEGHPSGPTQSLPPPVNRPSRPSNGPRQNLPAYSAPADPSQHPQYHASHSLHSSSNFAHPPPLDASPLGRPPQPNGSQHGHFRDSIDPNRHSSHSPTGQTQWSKPPISANPTQLRQYQSQQSQPYLNYPPHPGGLPPLSSQSDVRAVMGPVHPQQIGDPGPSSLGNAPPARMEFPAQHMLAYLPPPQLQNATYPQSQPLPPASQPPFSQYMLSQPPQQMQHAPPQPQSAGMPPPLPAPMFSPPADTFWQPPELQPDQRQNSDFYHFGHVPEGAAMNPHTGDQIWTSFMTQFDRQNNEAQVQQPRSS